MADPSAIVPYHDPFDETQTHDLLMFDESPSLDLPPQFPAFAEPNSLRPPQSVDEIADTDDPFMDPFWRSVLNDNIGNSEAGPSEICGETINEQQQEVPLPRNFDFGNPMQVPIWPVPPLPYKCTCCQVLREIIHTDGIHVTKLEIHGRLGIICHAVLETHSGLDWHTQKPQYQMFDFCKKSIDSVKQFLVQYCEGRKQEGYAMVQDPLLIFYEALCVGLNNGDANADVDDLFLSSPTYSGEIRMNHPETMNQPEAKNPRGPQVDAELRLPRTLAAQRERTANLTLNDVKQYFSLPIEDAARKMNVCPTVMKKICRRGGLGRWPYRRIKSIEKKILAKVESLNADDIEERKRTKAEIDSLEQELADIFGDG